MLLRETVFAPGRGADDLGSVLEQAWGVDGRGDREEFVLLLAVACGKPDINAFYEFASACLRRGLVWVATMGEGCELAHDLFNEAEVMLSIDEPDSAPQMTVLTTWHTGESASEVVDFLLDEARPDDGTAGARAYDMLVVADDENSGPLRAHLAARAVDVREI